MSNEQDQAAAGLPRNKPELMDRIRRSRAALEQAIAGLDEAALSAPGPDGGWSIKDHLAHLSDWDRRLLAGIQGRPPYEAMGVDRALWEADDLDRLNAALYERSRARAAAEVLAEFRATRQQVLDALEPLAEADLHRPFNTAEPTDTRPLDALIAGNTFGHDEEHLEWIRPLLPRR